MALTKVELSNHQSAHLGYRLAYSHQCIVTVAVIGSVGALVLPESSLTAWTFWTLQGSQTPAPLEGASEAAQRGADHVDAD